MLMSLMTADLEMKPPTPPRRKRILPCGYRWRSRLLAIRHNTLQRTRKLQRDTAA